MRSCFILFMVIQWFCSCNSRRTQEKTPTNNTSADEPGINASMLKLDPRLASVDSLIFVFYKNPLTEDSLRYSRFYTQYSSTDTIVISDIKTQVAQSTERFEKVKRCRNAGKIWCFSQGQIFQTLYFADFGGNCSFVFFIRNGQFYYSSLQPGLKYRLNLIKPLTKEP